MQTTSFRSRAHKWSYRIFLLLAAISLYFLCLMIDASATNPAALEAWCYFGIVVVHLILTFFVVALAFSNFDRLLFRLAQLLTLEATIIALTDVVFIVNAVAVRGLPKSLNWQAKSWYSEILALLFVLVGVCLRSAEKRVHSTTEAIPPNGLIPSASAVPSQDRRHFEMIIRRIAASLVDYWIWAFVLIVLAFVFGGRVQSTTPGVLYQSKGTEWFPLVTCWWWILYFVGIEALMGRSVGQSLTRLTIQREHPEDSRLKAAVLRHVFDPVEVFPFGIIALGCMIARSDGKRIGDMIAGTRVIAVS